MSSTNSVADLQWVEIALSRLLSTLTPTKFMIDVGAHHGTSLAPFWQVGWNVVAFEPIEVNRRQLAASFGAERLTIRPEAVSSISGSRTFHLALNLDGTLHEYHHSLEQTQEDPWHKKGPTVTVPTVSLDDLIARGELPAHVGFLKIDTEGHDLAVLQGAARLACDVISVEFWGDEHALGKSPSPVGAMALLLAERGYQSFIALDHDGDTTVAHYSSLQGIRADSWGNLFFFKEPALFRQVIEHRDWRFVLEISAECDRLRQQLREKEAQIRELDAAARLFEAAAAERLTLIQKQHQQLSRRAPFKKMLKSIARHLPGFGRQNDAA